MNYIDLFAGVGGFHHGIDRVNSARESKALTGFSPNTSDEPQWNPKPLTCVYSNEWDKYANSVYRRHYGQCDIRDIRTVNASEIPDFDLVVGGFPCQSFSVAGRRGGFADTRGTLFFEIARIVKEKQPRLLLLENVKGLLSHDKGETFRVILSSLDELGYDVQWQVLNSKDFGVPQNRERVFIIGHLRGTSRPEVFPIGGFNPASLNYVGGILSEKAKMWLDNGKKFSRNFPQGSRVYSDDGVSSTLASQAGGLGAKTGLYQVRKHYEGKERKIGLQKVDRANTITATYYKGPAGDGRNVVIPVLTPDRVNKRQNGRRFKEDGEPSFTLTQQDKHGVLLSRTIRAGGRGSTDEKHRWDIINDGVQIRRLTPRECERLQGFPDDWTSLGADGETISDTQRYRMMGNAVTTNVVTAIIEKLI